MNLAGGSDGGPALTGRNILVTGAAGFIGSHLVPELLRRGNRVVCLIRPGEDIDRIRGCECRIVHGDLAEKPSLAAAVAGAEYIFHLAAIMGGVTPEALLRVNLDGTRNLVEVCRDQGVAPERFLFVSSATVMGPSGSGTALDEGAPCRPVSAYGRSKLAAEKYLASQEDSLPYTIVRLPVVYGPGSDGGLFIFFKVVSKGWQVNVGTLRATVCFVNDAVQGMIAAAANPGARGKTYILGEEQAYDVKQVYRTIASLLGRRPITLPLPYFALHVASFFIEAFSRLKGSIPALTGEELTLYLKHRYWVYDTGRARRELGFQSRYPFAEGARLTLDWYRRHGFIR